MLAEFASTNAVGELQHARLLAAAGWSEEEYQLGVQSHVQREP